MIVPVTLPATLMAAVFVVFLVLMGAMMVYGTVSGLFPRVRQ